MNLLVTVEEKRKKTIGRRLKAVKSLKKFKPQSVYKTRMLEYVEEAVEEEAEAAVEEEALALLLKLVILQKEVVLLGEVVLSTCLC